jgi:DNA-binding FadR family transcriptional regulator
MMAAEVGRPNAYRDIAKAIRDGDPVAAEAAARALLEPATVALLSVIDTLGEAR